MQNNNETSQQLSGTMVKFIIGLLLAASLSSGGALLTIWRNFPLLEQRIDHVDTKYIVKSRRIEGRLDALAISLATHFSDDNAHQLLIQKQHLEFEGFMDMLDNAHTDIETLKHRCDVVERFGAETQE